MDLPADPLGHVNLSGKRRAVLDNSGCRPAFFFVARVFSRLRIIVFLKRPYKKCNTPSSGDTFPEEVLHFLNLFVADRPWPDV